MTLEALVTQIILGAVAGWLAGHLMRVRGMGLVRNVLIGIAGAFLGSWLFRLVGIHVARGTVGALLQAVCGAALLLFLLSSFTRHGAPRRRRYRSR